VTDDVFDLAACISYERDATRDFVDVLRREQHALQEADISLLPALAAEKARQAQYLTELADARNCWLTTRGQLKDRRGVEHVLEDLPAAAEVWNELLQLAETANRLNKINGTLISQRLRYVQQRLSVLQAPISSLPHAGLYTANGQPQSFSGGRCLAEG
jgi:flagella synthesis protein FlgN